MDWNELQSLTWPGYARKNGGKGMLVGKMPGLPF